MSLKRAARADAGFTLIELLMAMAVFSYMLLIIVMGFINVVNIHTQSVAADMVQDNSRTGMSELVRGVRDSTGVASVTGALPTGRKLCLNNAGGTLQSYYITAAGVLTRSDNCVGAPVNPQAITNASVKIVYFDAVQETVGASIVKPEIKLTLRVASSNGTTTGSGLTTACANTSQQRAFCTVSTLISGAVPR